MKKYSLLLLFFALVASSVSAQLVNQGGTITIQPGAKLVVESDVTNTTGTIVNNGTIEVEGNFTNAAMVTSAVGSKLVFTGATNSNFDGGASTYAIVENDKTAGNVVLTNSVSINEAVDFSGGTSNIVLGANNVNLTEAATTNGTQATGHFVTDGIGVVSKLASAAGTTTFDVGDAINYTPVEAVHTGTYGGVGAITAKVTPSVHPNNPTDVDAYISRYWDVEHVDITGISTALTGTYVAGDVTGTEANVVGARYEGSTWNYGAAAANSMVEGTTTVASSDLTGTNFYGKADLTFFLQAAYAGSSTMNKTLNDLGLIPTTSPYDNSIVAPAIPTNAVDWIEIEVRDATTGATVVSTSSAFLLTDGSVVGIDGTSLPLLKDALASTYVAVNHRNHLPIRTANQINLQTPTNINLSAVANVYDDPAVTTNDPQKDLGSGVMGMWMGDANGSNNTKYNGSGSDKIAVLVAVGFATPNNVLAGYHDADVEMDGDVSYNGAGSDKIQVLVTVGFATPNNVIENHAQK